MSDIKVLNRTKFLNEHRLPVVYILYITHFVDNIIWLKSLSTNREAIKCVTREKESEQLNRKRRLHFKVQTVTGGTLRPPTGATRAKIKSFSRSHSVSHNSTCRQLQVSGLILSDRLSSLAITSAACPRPACHRPEHHPCASNGPQGCAQQRRG